MDDQQSELGEDCSGDTFIIHQRESIIDLRRMATEAANSIQHSRKAHIQDRVYEYLSDRRIMAALTILPALGLFMFVNVLPILWAISGSFYDINSFKPEWTFVGIDNYVTLVNDPKFWASLSRSFVFAAGSVAVQMVVGIGVALLLNRSFKFDKLARAIGLIPYLIPSAVLGFIGLWMGNGQFGVINQFLVRLGILETNIAWFSVESLAMASVIAVSSWKLSIFVTLMVLSRLQSIPDNIYEAAQMSGASWYQQFRDITLPNLKGVIFIVLLLRGVWMFNKFDIIMVLTSGGPFDATTTAPIYAYEVAFRQAQLDIAATISVFLFVILIGVATVYFWLFNPSEGVRVE